jgi:prevent-host-death family protein
VDKTVSALEANRRFSQILRSVSEGDSYVVTSHGRPVARITPVEPETSRLVEARQVLLARLAAEPVIDIGRWTRDELYES